MRSITRLFSLLLASAVLLSGCAAGAEATLAPTISIPNEGIPSVATAYPLAADSPASGAPEAGAAATAYPLSAPEAAAYPAPTPEASAGGPPPAGVPVIENRSQVTAQLIMQSPVDDDPGLLRLHVLVTATQEVEGMPSFTAGQEGQEADLFIQAEQMVAIENGASFNAEVSYRGDEYGGKLVIIQFLP